ncbi:hypothetical protein BDC45DRAFT_99844 [Circinella umbellata]|nr:hypothetical protein BDC45DRAFT_99844 [Circinella umbellata]
MIPTNTLNSPPIQPTVTAGPTMHYTKDDNKNYNNHDNTAKHDPSSIPALLNKDHHDEQNFLPTPVTPANGFPLHLSSGNNNNDAKKENSSSSSSSNVIFAISGAQSDGTNKRLSNNSSNITTGNIDKNFTCRECDQTFTRPHNLKSHLATHSPERPFQCEICNHHFRRQHDLKRHKKLHTGERPYVCKSCSRSFARLDALNRHQRAEGGSACTSNSKKVNYEISVNNSNKNNNNNNNNNPQQPPQQQNIQQRVTPPRRPIPQLHIPHPASQPLPGQVYPHPSSVPPPPEKLLPSPSVLSTLPVSESPDLVPIHPFTSSSSPPSSSSSLASPSVIKPYQHQHHHSSRQHHQQQQQQQNNHHRLPADWQRLEQENNSLKAEIARLRSECEKKDALASEVHDLQVEVYVHRYIKVIRSINKYTLFPLNSLILRFFFTFPTPTFEFKTDPTIVFFMCNLEQSVKVSHC